MPQEHYVPCSSALFQQFLDSQRELGYSRREAEDHFDEVVAEAAQELWEDATQ